MDEYNRTLIKKLSDAGVDVSDVVPPTVNTECIELEPSKIQSEIESKD